MQSLLATYRRIYSELLLVGATESEAQSLAAHLTARNCDSAVDIVSHGLSSLRSLKSAPDAETYAYRGDIIRISDLNLRKSTKGHDQLHFKLSCRVGREDIPLPLKSDRAVRILTLIILKFEQFVEDSRGGFDMIQISDREDELIKAFAQQGHQVTHPSTVRHELNRNIRTKAREVLRLEHFLGTTSDRYRIEFAPGCFTFETHTLALLNELTHGAIDKWFETFELSQRQVS